MTATSLFPTGDSAFVEIDLAEGSVRIEYRWLFPERRDAPLLVFLHEGLGSLAMWRGFPESLCAAAGYRGLVFSRPAYGRSTPRDKNTHWGTDFLHIQAIQVLPALFHALGVDPARDRPWLFGHSDGGSIALIYAATYPRVPAGLVVLAPHIHVEEMTIQSIAEAKQKFIETDLRTKLGRYHDDVDSAFWGWNDVWLDPAFRSWEIHRLLPAISCPILAIQGEDDEYGTMAQIEGIHRARADTALLKLAACGHSPHRDQPAEVIAATKAFVAAHGDRGADVEAHR